MPSVLVELIHTCICMVPELALHLQAKLLQTCLALEGSRGGGPMSYVGGEETGTTC